MTHVREQISSWVDKGYVEKVGHQPYFTNPLTVAVRYNGETGVQSLRTCLDLSRSLNLLLEECHSKLDDLKTVIPR